MIWGIILTIFLLVLIIIANFLLNITILPYFEVMGILPNTALAMVVVIALSKGRYYGGFFGIFIGLLHDILFSVHIGINGLIFFFIGYLVGLSGNVFTRDNIINPVIFTSLGTVVYNLSYFLYLYFTNIEFTYSYLIRRVVSIEIIYNALIAIVIYKIFKKIFGKTRLSFNRNKR